MEGFARAIVVLFPDHVGHAHRDDETLLRRYRFAKQDHVDVGDQLVVDLEMFDGFGHG